MKSLYNEHPQAAASLMKMSPAQNQASADAKFAPNNMTTYVVINDQNYYKGKTSASAARLDRRIE